MRGRDEALRNRYAVPGYSYVVAGSLVKAQAAYNGLPESVQTIVSIGLSLGKGPIGAVGSYALDQAVDKVMRETGLNRLAAQVFVALGTNGLSILSDSELEVEQENAARNGGSEAILLTQAGGTILGIASITAALKKLAGKPKVTVADGGDLVSPPDARPNGRVCSFDGATLVKAMRGLTPIRDIRAGNDQVWSRDAGNPGTGEIRGKYGDSIPI